MEKRPFASAERLEGVVAEYPTPLQVYDERTIRSRVRALLDAFSWNQGFREYFAVKATPTPAILRLLADMGCGCDCATSTELVMAEACGVSGRRVMLSSSDTPDETYRIAHGMGAIVNLDGLDMVDCLERSLGCLPETVCCRLNPGGTFESANGIIGNPSESKFGMTEDQVKRDVRLAAQWTRKFVTIEQLAGVALFPCSDSAENITGVALPVDGGWTAIDGPPTGLTATRPSE